MEFWLAFLPLVIYILLIILLIVGIILGIKTIITMNKVEKSLNSVFNLIDFTTDKIAAFTDRLAEVAGSVFSKLLFRNKNKKRKKDDYEEE